MFDLDKIDTFFAGTSRPLIALCCGLAVAGACFIRDSAPIAIPSAAAIASAWMVARSIDKKTSANADVAKTTAGAAAPVCT
jgi:hypothetical protein